MVDGFMAVSPLSIDIHHHLPRTRPAISSPALATASERPISQVIRASLVTQVASQALPGRQTFRHGGAGTLSMPASVTHVQDEGRHRGRQIHALGQAAGRDDAAIAVLAQTLARVWLPTVSTAPAQRPAPGACPEPRG